MLSTLFGLHIAEKFKARSDRIVFMVSVPAEDSLSITMVDAVDGARLKDELGDLDFVIMKYALWSQSGMVEVDIKPDSEATNEVVTYALTEKTESTVTPPGLVLVDVEIELTNNQSVSDDVYIVFDILKVPQTQRPRMMDYIDAQSVALENIDIQTLGIEKFLTYTNLLLEELIRASGGTVPNEPYPEYEIQEKEQPVSCVRI